jgi:leader peptidase (prepilin peptidase)/N-methyltransferase
LQHLYLGDGILSDLPEELIGFFVFFIGICLGSFANVVIYRLPRSQSVVRPRSRCPSCKKAILWYDNIPVFSWLYLRGKCRKCKKGISARYPFVELLMGLLYLAIFVRFGLTWTTLEYLVLTFGLVAVSFIDLDHRIIPDEFSLSGIVLGILGSVINPERTVMDSVLGVLLGGGFFWAIAYLYLLLRKQEGLGGGDIKLLAWIGAYLGWVSIPFTILASSLLGTIFGLVLIARGGNLKSSLPFGPFIVVAAYVYLFVGEDLARWYIGLFLDLSTAK